MTSPIFLRLLPDDTIKHPTNTHAEVGQTSAALPMPSIPIHTGRNGVHTHQRLRKTPLQFGCKKKWTVDLPIQLQMSPPAGWTSLPSSGPAPGAAWATPARAGAPALQLVVPAGRGAAAAHLCSGGCRDAEMTMTSQRTSRNRSKAHRTDEFLRGTFPANDPRHKNWGNEHLFPERRDLAYPDSISSGLSTL